MASPPPQDPMASPPLPTAAPHPSLLIEIGPDGITRESPVIAYTERIIEAEKLQLKRYIQENYSKIREVEREFENLTLELKLTAGSKKAALEHLRKKIELSAEKIHAAKLKEEQAKKNASTEVAGIVVLLLPYLAKGKSLYCMSSDHLVYSYSRNQLVEMQSIGTSWSKDGVWLLFLTRFHAVPFSFSGPRAHAHMIAWEAAAQAVKNEEAIKLKICDDLNQLVQESTSTQFLRLEELKRRLEALNPSRISSDAPDGKIIQQTPSNAAGLPTAANQSAPARVADANAAASSSRPASSDEKNQRVTEMKDKKRVINSGRAKGNMLLSKGRGSGSGWTGSGFNVDSGIETVLTDAGHETALPEQDEMQMEESEYGRRHASQCMPRLWRKPLPMPAPASILERFREAVFKLMISSVVSKGRRREMLEEAAARQRLQLAPDSYRSEAVEDCIKFFKRSAAANADRSHCVPEEALEVM
ncbi:hypothetical protein ZIOFF_032600 [Zingiber officinale]|uniref:Uncharacterized protein n=1 Tax=Zingiber officinale TaxID=94328 RepID=A0A8J5GNW1_ZINOF|nr:hypothetical protein ZIOFF_032600 [Zingiber officinale]